MLSASRLFEYLWGSDLRFSDDSVGRISQIVLRLMHSVTVDKLCRERRKKKAGRSTKTTEFGNKLCEESFENASKLLFGVSGFQVRRWL